jgi:hypothetical protein
MADLSPAAQAVWDAWEKTPVSLDIVQTDREALAAALRAAAYQVAPARPVLDSCCEHFEQSIRHKILAIANELDPPSS